MIEISLPSDLYRFRLDDLQEFRFNEFCLINVFERITPQQREACIELWLRNGVMPSREAALKRSDQVCYCITENKTGKLIGVNTLYIAGSDDALQNVWLNRMFIDPRYRNTRLMITGTAMMLCFAKTYLADRGLRGVVNVNENRKLSRAGMRKIFSRLGYRQVGEQLGNEVIFFDFNNINFTELEA